MKSNIPPVYKAAPKYTSTMNVLRIITLSLATLGLLLMLMSAYSKTDGIMFFFLAITVSGGPLLIPLIPFWIYSFVLSLIRNTSIEKKFRLAHFIDLVLLGLSIMGCNNSKCNADIMEEHYEKHGLEMRQIIKATRQELPKDSAYVIYEMGDGLVNTEMLNSKQIDKLEDDLDDIGCIGIEIYRNDDSSATIRFRRVLMAMYSFILYDYPLSKEKQDSINKDCSLIVYNDSTVFAFGAGAFGDLSFPGKEEYLEKRILKSQEQERKDSQW